MPAHPSMRRFIIIATCVLAIVLTVVGARFLLKAARTEGLAAAAPAVIGLLCWMGAAVCVGRRAVGLVMLPFTVLFDQLFYPRSCFTEPPESLLLSLRCAIADRRFRYVERQLAGLLKAYPRDAGLLKLKEELDAAKAGGPGKYGRAA